MAIKIVSNNPEKLKKQLEILKKFINAEELLSENEWVAFSSIWEIHTVKRKENITHSQQTEKYLYFVIEGVQRVYYSSKDGHEATITLTYPHSFGGVLDSFLLQKQSNYNYESLTPSVLIRAPYKKFMEVTTNNTSLDNLIKKLTYEALSGLLERMAELQCYTSEEKFKTLLNRSPQILQLVPHKYLANYLGIDPTNFSKLLNGVKI